jgi:hypothetical protein
MVTVASGSLEAVDIKLADKQMDIMVEEDTNQEHMTVDYSGEVVELDIDIRMVQEDYKEKTMTLMGGHLPGEEVLSE